MANRLDLHEELCEVLGSRNVYYQPPASVQMKYDAIRYSLSGKNLKRADDAIYRITNEYSGVYITRDPESTIPDKLLYHFKMISFGSPYTADNLTHFPFTIYY